MTTQTNTYWTMKNGIKVYLNEVKLESKSYRGSNKDEAEDMDFWTISNKCRTMDKDGISVEYSNMVFDKSKGLK